MKAARPRWTNHVETPLPVRDRRLTGEHWWDPDRLAHADDHPRFCPACGGSLLGEGAIAVEFWQADRRVYHTAHFACGWTGDIARVQRMVGPESPHE